jgi:cyclic pyranopterin phosphate synthase
MSELSHFDEAGASRMVDVSGKEITLRTARASGCVRMQPSTLEMVRDRRLSKGDVLEVARLAGIMASKRTGELIPLCHPLGVEAADLSLWPEAPDVIRVEARVKTAARTGVEMEALVAVSTACLTIYDMCKAVDRSMVIGEIQLEEKSGGRRGTYRRAGAEPDDRRAGEFDDGPTSGD